MNFCFVLINRCTCGNCTVMESHLECVCCQEQPKVVFRCKEEDPQPTCITQHPGFDGVALNHHNLRAVYFHYAQQYNGLEGIPTHK